MTTLNHVTHFALAILLVLAAPVGAAGAFVRGWAPGSAIPVASGGVVRL